MQIEPWHIPLLAMVLVIFPPSMMSFAGWWRKKVAESKGKTVAESRLNPVKRELLRTRTLAFMTVVLLGVCYIAIGPAAANFIATLASFIATIVSAALTLQSYLLLQEVRRSPREEENSR